MSIDTIYADDIDASIKRWARNPGPAPEPGFSMTSFLGAAVSGIPAATLEASGSVADLVSGFGNVLAATGGSAGGMFSVPSAAEQKQEAEARARMLASQNASVAMGNTIRGKAESFGPDPLTAHTADQVIHGLTRFATKVIADVGLLGPVGGAAVLGLDEANTTTQKLRVEGVDTETAAKVGAVTGAISATGVVLPLGGKTIAQTLGLIGVGGPGAYMTQEHVSRRILEEAGYRDQASLHNPFDPLGLALSTILPGAFGALHMRGLKFRTEAEAKEAAKLSPQEQARSDAYETSEGNLTQMREAIAAEKRPEAKAALQEAYDKLKAQADARGAADAAIQKASQDPAVVDAARVQVLNETTARSLPDTPDAMAQVQRAADIVGASGGRAAEAETPPVADPFPALPRLTGGDLIGKTFDELDAMHTQAVDHNRAVSLEGIRRFYGDERAAEAQGWNNRKLDGWLSKNVTDAADDWMQARYINEDLIKDHRAAVNDFDIGSPQELGRSIAVRARNVDEPGFFQAAEGQGFVNALRYAKEQGWNMDEVMGGMRDRSAQWAGADARELFARLFQRADEAKALAIQQRAPAESAVQTYNRVPNPWREANNSLPDSNSVGLDDAPVARAKEVGTKPDTAPQAKDAPNPRELGDLRKREKVLAKLLECLEGT